jgi:hypothetical protein
MSIVEPTLGMVSVFQGSFRYGGYNILLSLHNVIIGEPVKFVVTLINTRWVDADGLVVGHVPPAFPISCQQLWVETPSDDRARN